MSYTMYTPLNVWLDPASVTDVVAYIQTYLSENTIYSETEIETIIHDYLIAHPELIGGVQSVNGKTGTVVLSASDINTENNVTIESVLASLSSQISTIAANVSTNTDNITSLTGRVSTAETDISNLKSSLNTLAHEITIVATSSGNNYVNFEIKNRNLYKIVSSSSATISCATVNENNQTVQSLDALPAGQNKQYVFTANADAPKMLFYFRAAGTVTVYDLSARVALLEEKTLKTSWYGEKWVSYGDSISWAFDWHTYVNNVLKFTDFYRNGIVGSPIAWIGTKTLIGSSQSTGNVYKDISIVAGETYEFWSTSASNTTFATVTATGETIESIGHSMNGNIITFTPTQNAGRVLAYFRAAGEAYVETQPQNVGIDANGIYAQENPVDYVPFPMCSYERISKTINNTAPLIFVMGGTNDFLGSAVIGDLSFNSSSELDSAWHDENPIGDYNIKTLKGALASMLMKLHYHAPNALIVFGTLCNGTGDTTGVNQYSESINSASLKPSDYAQAEREVCSLFGIPCIDVFSNCGINITNRADYISDNVHPNAEGYKLLARCIVSGLLNEYKRF